MEKLNKETHINEALRRAREQRGWTQKMLADKMGVAEQTIGSWERQSRFPSTQLKVRLSTVLEKTIEELDLLDAPFDVKTELPVEQKMESDQAQEEVQKVKLHPSSYSTTLPEIMKQISTTPVSEEVAIQGLEERVTRNPFPLQRHSSLHYQGAQRTDEKQLQLLKRVQSRWITGFLDHIVSGELLLPQLQEYPTAVNNPWQGTLSEVNIPPHLFLAGTHIHDVYNYTNQELLILGESGAGKTVLLLQLARYLIEQAMHQEDTPMPVVLNLSSWSEQQLPIIDWLVSELNRTYSIPHKIGQMWAEADLLLPLLDGLDEVAETCRTACIEAINMYRKEHGLVPLVLCCRSSDYFAQTARLTLRHAVEVQPLTPQQVHQYFDKEGEHFAALHTVLQQDHLLQEMISTPLMMDTFKLSFDETTIDTLISTRSREGIRQLVFHACITRLLQRRGQTAQLPYSDQQILDWLSWLARKLAEQQQTEFYVERMQPEQLLSPHAHQCYRRMIVRIIFGIEIFINALLFSILRGGKKGTVSGIGFGIFGWLGVGSGNRGLGWMAPGLGGGLEGGGSLGILLALVTILVILLARTSMSPLSIHVLRQSLKKGLIAGLIILLLVGSFSAVILALNGGLIHALYRGLGFGLFSGLLVGLMSGLITGFSSHEKERPFKNQHPRSSRQIFTMHRLIDMFIFSACGALGFGGSNVLQTGLEPSVLVYTAIVGCFYGITFGFAGGTDLLAGLGNGIQPAESVSWSWPQVALTLSQSLKKGLFVGIWVAICVSILLGIASATFYGFPYGLHYGAVYGSIIGLVGGVATSLTDILRNGWSSAILDERELFRPNEGIHRSWKHALFAASLFGPIGGLASGLACGLAFGIVGGLSSAPILGLGFTLVLGMIFTLQFLLLGGGIACIEHLILRWYLWRARCIPRDYIAFLDYAAKRILLRKIGGGYMFTHRLFLDYFAALSPKYLAEAHGVDAKQQECEHPND